MAFRRLLTQQVRSQATRFSGSARARTAAAPMRFNTAFSQRQFSVAKPKDGGLAPLYDLIMKNNATYVFSIVVFAAAAGVIFNEGVDAVWETANRGKLYHHINWDQFAEEEEEDDDDDEDDDEDDDDE